MWGHSDLAPLCPQAPGAASGVLLLPLRETLPCNPLDRFGIAGLQGIHQAYDALHAEMPYRAIRNKGAVQRPG